MKKLYLLIISVSFILVFSGCNQIKINSFSSINEDGTGQFKFEVCYDELISNSLSGNLISSTKLAQLQENGISLRKYYKNGYTYEELCYELTKPDKSSNIFLDTMICNGSLQKERGLKADTYTLNISFNHPLIDCIFPLIDDVAIETLSHNSYSNTSPLDYLKQLPINNQIKLPGRILNTNATEVLSSNTLSWGYKLGQIDEQTVMTVTYQIDQPVRYNIFIFSMVFITIIVIICTGIYIYKRKYFFFK